MWVLCSGDVVDGFDFIGPFATKTEAEDYGNDLDHRDWMVARLIPPLANVQLFPVVGE